MGLLQELLGVVLLLISSIGRALGATPNYGRGNDAEHTLIGALALLFFWMWRRAGIYRMERDLLLFQLREETKRLQQSQTSQDLREELCRRLDLIYDALGKR